MDTIPNPRYYIVYEFRHWDGSWRQGWSEYPSREAAKNDLWRMIDERETQSRYGDISEVLTTL